MLDLQPLIDSLLPGIVAIFGGGRRGACVAPGDHAYRSTVPGKMHACGHDGHVERRFWREGPQTA
jgi:hypothetical protein